MTPPPHTHAPTHTPPSAPDWVSERGGMGPQVLGVRRGAGALPDRRAGTLLAGPQVRVVVLQLCGCCQSARPSVEPRRPAPPGQLIRPDA